MKWNTIAERLGINARTLRHWRKLDGFPTTQNLGDIQAWKNTHEAGSAQAERRSRERDERDGLRKPAAPAATAAPIVPGVLTIETAEPRSIAQLKQLAEARGKTLLNREVTDKIREEERALMLERWRGFVAALHSGVAAMELNRKQKLALNRAIDNAWEAVL